MIERTTFFRFNCHGLGEDVSMLVRAAAQQWNRLTPCTLARSNDND